MGFRKLGFMGKLCSVGVGESFYFQDLSQSLFVLESDRSAPRFSLACGVSLNLSIWPGVLELARLDFSGQLKRFCSMRELKRIVYRASWVRLLLFQVCCSKNIVW